MLLGVSGILYFNAVNAIYEVDVWEMGQDFANVREMDPFYKDIERIQRIFMSLDNNMIFYCYMRDLGQNVSMLNLSSIVYISNDDF